MSHNPTERRSRRRPLPRLGIYLVALVATVLALGFVWMPRNDRLRAAGPANTGHEQLDCAQCHTPAEGTPRQQIQANVRFLLGLRETGTEFIHKEVGNVDCVACHQNDNDRHPVYRFNEPRFAEVRAELAPQLCVSCHVEHTGERVTAQPTVCMSCHVDIELRQDPIQPSHFELAFRDEWESCLRCHDFHGNHVGETPLDLDGTPTAAEVAEYFSGGRKIYGEEIRFPARTLRIDR